MAHLGYLNYTQYTVTVGFEHLNQPIREMNFTVSTHAPAAAVVGAWERQCLVWLILENQFFKCVEPRTA